jgi:hypothetical protein
VKAIGLELAPFNININVNAIAQVATVAIAKGGTRGGAGEGRRYRGITPEVGDVRR